MTCRSRSPLFWSISLPWLGWKIMKTNELLPVLYFNDFAKYSWFYLMKPAETELVWRSPYYPWTKAWHWYLQISKWSGHQPRQHRYQPCIAESITTSLKLRESYGCSYNNQKYIPGCDEKWIKIEIVDVISEIWKESNREWWVCFGFIARSHTRV